MISFDTRELERAARAIERLNDSIPQIAGDELVAQVREFAASGRNPDGTAWKPLTKPYGDRKQKLVGNRLPNKRVTSGLLNSVKNRGMVVAPDDAHLKQAQGLERKRISFEPSPLTAQNVERIILRGFNKI